jgi:shikimate dehydrogenase
VGAGGAARAIGFVLRERGLPLTIVNRSREKGEALAEALGCNYAPLGEIEKASVDLLIHATPAGMFPRSDECIVPAGALKEGMVVMDAVYNPMETLLLKLAGERDCSTVGGLGMFIHQGAEQFRLWTGLDAPVGIMTRVVEESLGRVR